MTTNLTKHKILDVALKNVSDKVWESVINDLSEELPYRDYYMSINAIFNSMNRFHFMSENVSDKIQDELKK